MKMVIFTSIIIIIWWVNGASDCSSLSHTQLCLLVGLGGTALWGLKISFE